LPQVYKDILNTRRAFYNPVELQQHVNKGILRQRQRLAKSNRIKMRKRE
jgi:hypothetical protein